MEFSLNEISLIGRLSFEVFSRLRLIKIFKVEGVKVTCNNFTLLNLMLIIFGPTHEETLTIQLLVLQVCTQIMSILAFGLHFHSTYMYN